MYIFPTLLEMLLPWTFLKVLHYLFIVMAIRLILYFEEGKLYTYVCMLMISSSTSLLKTAWVMPQMSFPVPGRCKDMDGCNGLWFNPSKVVWLWVLGLSGVKIFPPLILNGVALPQMCVQSGGPLGLTAPIGRADGSHGWTSFFIPSGCTRSWTRRLYSLSLMPLWPPSRLLGLEALELQLVQNAAAPSSKWCRLFSTCNATALWALLVANWCWIQVKCWLSLLKPFMAWSGFLRSVFPNCFYLIQQDGHASGPTSQGMLAGRDHEAAFSAIVLALWKFSI